MNRPQRFASLSYTQATNYSIQTANAQCVANPSPAKISQKLKRETGRCKKKYSLNMAVVLFLLSDFNE